MSRTREKQLELFEVRGEGLTAQEIHALGLLGWKDPLWTKQLEIPLIGGRKLSLRLVDVRALVRWPPKKDSGQA